MPSPIAPGDLVYYDYKMGDHRYHVFRVEECRSIQPGDLNHPEWFASKWWRGARARLFLTPINAHPVVVGWLMLDTKRPTCPAEDVRRVRPATAIKRGWITQ